MGVEAEVLLRMPTIWSKQLSLGAVSWFSGILSASTFSFCEFNKNVRNGTHVMIALGLGCLMLSRSVIILGLDPDLD